MWSLGALNSPRLLHRNPKMMKLLQFAGGDVGSGVEQTVGGCLQIGKATADGGVRCLWIVIMLSIRCAVTYACLSSKIRY